MGDNLVPNGPLGVGALPLIVLLLLWIAHKNNPRRNAVIRPFAGSESTAQDADSNRWGTARSLPVAWFALDPDRK